MQAFCGNLIRRQTLNSFNITNFKNAGAYLAIGSSSNGVSASRNHLSRLFHHLASCSPVTLMKLSSHKDASTVLNGNGTSPKLKLSLWPEVGPSFPSMTMTTAGNSVESATRVDSEPNKDVASRIKFKRLDKTARNIMQILDKEAVLDVRTQREIPDIKPGYIVQLKVEVPENKRRVSIVKGIVIARRNVGLNTTFRLRRLVAGVGVESLFPLYSPNIKEIKVLEKKKVRRAKLYYLRDKMNALKK